MILFCDTSALIKLLIDEPGSEQIHQASHAAPVVAACRITWAEAIAAMARRQREDPLSSEAIEQARERLNQLWLLRFACFDRRLHQATQILKLAVLP